MPGPAAHAQLCSAGCAQITHLRESPLSNMLNYITELYPQPYLSSFEIRSCHAKLAFKS